MMIDNSHSSDTSPLGAGLFITEIEDNGIELVVVGSHGHGAVFNIIAGSVTQALLHRAKVPVLVVPTKRPK